jgi:transcriptional accessory protein Tex/SPT6
VKNPDFTPKNHIFSNFREGARRVRPLDPPLYSAEMIALGNPTAKDTEEKLQKKMLQVKKRINMHVCIVISDKLKTFR